MRAGCGPGPVSSQLPCCSGDFCRGLSGRGVPGRVERSPQGAGGGEETPGDRDRVLADRPGPDASRGCSSTGLQPWAPTGSLFQTSWPEGSGSGRQRGWLTDGLLGPAAALPPAAAKRPPGPAGPAGPAGRAWPPEPAFRGSLLGSARSITLLGLCLCKGAGENPYLTGCSE